MPSTFESRTHAQFSQARFQKRMKLWVNEELLLPETNTTGEDPGGSVRNRWKLELEPIVSSLRF